MDSWRTTETRLARLTLAAVAVFAPVEAYASWQMLGGARALIHPAYLNTFTGTVLMLVGAMHSLRARPRVAPGLMCASHAWMAAYGWRSTYLRVDAMSRGVELHFGDAELWATGAATVLAMGAFALSLFLTSRVVSEPGQRTAETRLAKLTLWGLASFAPLETYASWEMAGGGRALMHPGYLHSLTGMVLLFAGARHSLAARPTPRAGPAVCLARVVGGNRMACDVRAHRRTGPRRAAVLRFARVVGRGLLLRADARRVCRLARSDLPVCVGEGGVGGRCRARVTPSGARSGCFRLVVSGLLQAPDSRAVAPEIISHASYHVTQKADHRERGKCFADSAEECNQRLEHAVILTSRADCDRRHLAHS